MKTLYAPLPPEGWDYWLDKDTLMNIIFVLFVFAALFLVYKHQEFKQIRRVRTYFIVFFIGSTLAYNLTMSNIRADKRQYQIYIDNSAKLETFSGVIEFVGNKKKAWPGHFHKYDDDYLWDVFTIITPDDEWSVIWEIQTREHSDLTKPPCYEGDIFTLLLPYVGKKVTIRYFSFISS
ncbi:hypothetical protein H5073_18005, partial [Shewanella sp. SR44-3]|nr:hypothetical protein [Shewanella sp. SR44-3]